LGVLIFDCFLHAVGRLAAAAALLSFGVPTAAMAQSVVLSQKAGEANAIIGAARQGGQVRVIVGFESPVAPSQLKLTGTGVAGAAAQIAAVQDLILGRHFGSASSEKVSGFSAASGGSRSRLASR
jgi:hypothetical protein